MAKRSGVLAGAMLALGLLASPAGATEMTVGCAGLQSALTGAKAGDKITLNELCKSGFPYVLPAVPATLVGTPGAGFDGGATVQLEGSGASPTIEGLIFENATNPATKSGGALSLNVAGKPATVTLAHDTFVNDHTPNGEGGAARINTNPAVVTVSDTTFSGNSAGGVGGALEIFGGEAKLSDDTFSGNSATGPEGLGGALYASTGIGPITLSGSQFNANAAVGGGGGAVLETGTSGTGFVLSDNTFSHNSVSDPGGVSSEGRGHLGGGLSLFTDATTPSSAVQSANTFDANTVSFKAAPVSAMGGGESTTRVALQSTGDRFTNNALQPPSEATIKGVHVFGWGAGLSVAQCSDTTETPPAGPTSSRR